MTGIKEARGMTDELMEQRMAELNVRNTEKAPAFDSEKRAYSVDDIMEILDISRSSAYILIKKNLFRSVKIGNQLRISKASFDKWLDNGWLSTVWFQVGWNNRTFEEKMSPCYNAVKAKALAALVGLSSQHREVSNRIWTIKLNMNDKIMEHRVLEHNARNAEMIPVHIKEKRA